MYQPKILHPTIRSLLYDFREEKNRSLQIFGLTALLRAYGKFESFLMILGGR